MTMHMTDVSPQVRMANEIAVQFVHRPQDEAAATIAAHIRSFWEPRMKEELRRLITTEAESFHPLALAAARLLFE